MNVSPHYDVAVIGGGIAGLYCSLAASPGRNVALFEATGRIGGRIETVFTSGFRAEYGSMRFDPGTQGMIARLLKGLGLETEPFPEYSSPPAGESGLGHHLGGEEKGLNALELFALGVGRVLGKSASELIATSDEELDYLRRKGTHRNSPLWRHGLWSVLADVLSYDAVKYIMTEGSFFHGIHENPGVSGTMITWVKMLRMSKHLNGVKGGAQQITDRMLEEAKRKGVTVNTGHSLQAIKSSAGGKLKLNFNTGDVTANRVILAMPSMMLKTIKGLPGNIRTLLDTVIEYPLLKCFFVVKNPWWEEDVPNRGAGAFPTRELHYYRQGNKGMVMVYADRPGINFWLRYADPAIHDRAELHSNRELPLAFANRMSINPENVIDFGIRDWTRAPYGAGVHLWKPGVEFWKVSEQLEAFSLDGNPPYNVHICGEAFSDYQGFMEGALRSAHNALTKALN